MKPESAAHAAQALRDSDRDRYCRRSSSRSERAAVAALYAFNADIASVPERAREPAAGEIRLRWWTEHTGQEQAMCCANPVADALISTLEKYGLPDRPFERLLEARRFDLYQDPMPDTADVRGLCRGHGLGPVSARAMVLNGGRPVEPGDAAGHLGVVHALVGHLRAFGLNAGRGRVFLPWSVYWRPAASRKLTCSPASSEGLAVALTRLAETASEHLDKGGVAIAALPGPLRPAFAQAAVLRPQLR